VLLSIQHVKIESQTDGVVSSLCHTIISCFIKICNGFSFLILAYPSFARKEAAKLLFACLFTYEHIRRICRRSLGQNSTRMITFDAPFLVCLHQEEWRWWSSERWCRTFSAVSGRLSVVREVRTQNWRWQQQVDSHEMERSCNVKPTLLNFAKHNIVKNWWKKEINKQHVRQLLSFNTHHTKTTESKNGILVFVCNFAKCWLIF